MINAFKLENSYLIKEKNNLNIKNSFWIDLININYNDFNKINENFKLKINKNMFLDDFTYIILNNNIYIKYLFINNFNNSSYIIFNINNNKLFSIRNKKNNLYYIYFKIYKNIKFYKNNPYELLIRFFNINLTNIYHNIKNIFNKLKFFENNIIYNRNFYNTHKNILYEFSILKNFSWKIRLSLINTQEILFFLDEQEKLKINNINTLKKFISKIDTLLFNNEFIFQKINFLILSDIEFINIEQNKIIKNFSVIATIFLPPTLIASSYGMNFNFIPELKWKFGYFFAIFIMILSAIFPYLYFKKKKWI